MSLLNEKDIKIAENLQKALHRAEFKDLRGLEVVALAQSMVWFKELIEKSKKQSSTEIKTFDVTGNAPEANQI